MHALTVLKSTKVKITDTKIELDLSVLKKQWERKKFMDESEKNVFNKYVENINILPTWTQFSVREHPDIENALIISVDEDWEEKYV